MHIFSEEANNRILATKVSLLKKLRFSEKATNYFSLRKAQWPFCNHNCYLVDEFYLHYLLFYVIGRGM